MTTTRSKIKGPPAIEVVRDGVTLAIQPEARTDLYNTFRVGGPADFLVRAGDAEEVALAYAWAREQGLLVTIFGGGSNLLVGDRGVRGLVIVVRRPGKAAEAGLAVLDDNAESALVRVPAAAPSNWLGRTAAERGWAGLTWLVGLPGNVGGAVVNNAGAHGGEMQDHLVSLRVVDAAGHLVEHERVWLEPSYRYTTLKFAPRPREHVVVDALFRFQKGEPPTLQSAADDYAEYRHRTQPTGACAGSIFKNPEGDFSGRLIEASGLKGTRVGGAVVSDVHANFIVNDRGATAADIIELMARVRETVRQQHGVELEPEIERIGDWS